MLNFVYMHMCVCVCVYIYIYVSHIYEILNIKFGKIF